MSEHSPRILIFDSGIGGLSVARCIHHRWPSAGLVYLADNARFPYGDLPESEVTERCCELIGGAQADWACDIVVVACNTASTVALPALRAMLDVPVVGVVPAIKPAAARSENRKLGLLATPATIKRPYLDNLITAFADDCEVTRIGHPGFVQWAEALVGGTPPPVSELRAVLTPLREAGVDTVVLGCTHYPLLQPWLTEALPEVHAWVDSGEAIARRVAHLLEVAGFDARQNEDRDCRSGLLGRVFTGGEPEGLVAFMAGLGLSVSDVFG